MQKENVKSNMALKNGHDDSRLMTIQVNLAVIPSKTWRRQVGNTNLPELLLIKFPSQPFFFVTTLDFTTSSPILFASGPHPSYFTARIFENRFSPSAEDPIATSQTTCKVHIKLNQFIHNIISNLCGPPSMFVL